MPAAAQSPLTADGVVQWRVFSPTSTGRFITAQGLVWWHFKQNTVSEIKAVFITSLTVIKAWESQAGVARVMPTTLIYVTVERVFIREGSLIQLF